MPVKEKCLKRIQEVGVFYVTCADKNTKENGKRRAGGPVLFENNRRCNPGRITVDAEVFGCQTVSILHAAGILRLIVLCKHDNLAKPQGRVAAPEKKNHLFLDAPRASF